MLVGGAALPRRFTGEHSSVQDRSEDKGSCSVAVALPTPGVLPTFFGAISCGGEQRAARILLFPHEDGHTVSALQFLHVLHKALRHVGFPTEDYGTHSFRIGVTTEAG